MPKLSSHQLKIARLVALGYSNRDIASELSTSEQAIKSALHAVFDKLGVWNRVELALRIAPSLPEEEGLAVPERLERARLAAIRGLALSGDLPQAALDDIVLVLSTVCRTPMALLSIVEADRLWFVSRRGLNTREVKRKASFCEQVVQGSGFVEIRDALEDRRYREHPMVTAAPRLRFYAAAPLITTEGYAVGTLCVLDVVPRKLAKSQQDVLLRLGRVASSLLQRAPELTRSPAASGDPSVPAAHSPGPRS